MDAQKQARFFLKQVHLEPGDLPPVLVRGKGREVDGNTTPKGRKDVAGYCRKRIWRETYYLYGIQIQIALSEYSRIR